MRLPFMQLESDLLAHAAPQVGSLAGCGPIQALGHIAYLRAWAVAQATDDAPPDGWARGADAAEAIESAACWGGEPGRLLRALRVAKLVLVTPEGVQVLGLEPYRAAWEKNQKAKARMDRFRARNANVRVTDGEHERTNGDPASTDDVRSAKFGGQTQTQTQTQKESSSLSAGADEPEELPDATDDAQPVAQPPLFAVETPPEKPKRKTGPDPETLRAVWNRIAPPLGFQVWEAMGDDRKRDARLALEACPDLAKWEAWLRHELARPWNRGENDDGWKANVAWFLRKKNRDLVIDFSPTAAQGVRTASGGDVPRLGPRPSSHQPTSDKPRL
jgi:hypothetical protein